MSGKLPLLSEIPDGAKVVIASSVSRMSSVKPDWETLPDCEVFTCRKCGAEVWINTVSRRKIASGYVLLCVECALSITQGQEVKLENPDSTALAATDFLSYRAIQEADE